MFLHSNNMVKDVLFIPSGSIGDALMMLALCKEMGELDPQLRFTIIARRNGRLIKDLAGAYPSITVLIINKNLNGVWKLLWNSFKRPYIALMPGAFGLSSVWNTELFFKLLAWRPGTSTNGLLKRANDPNPYQKSLVYDAKALHFDNLRRLAVLGGLPVAGEGSPVSLAIHTALPSWFDTKEHSYIVFHPFGSSSWKSWPPRRSRELLEQFVVRYPQLDFVVTGGPENREEAEGIVQGIPRTSLAVGLPILEVAGIIGSAALYVGVDTGMTHLASVMSKRVIALEHNASPEWLPVYNPKAIILTTTGHCVCGGVKNDACKVIEDGKPYLRCLYEIQDDTIVDAVDAYVPKNSH